MPVLSRALTPDRTPSLRRRLTLVVVGLAGGGLVGFALLSGLLIYQAKLDRLDAQIHSALRMAARPRSRRSADPVEVALGRELGLPPTHVALLSSRPGNDQHYRSAHWPLADLALPPPRPLGPDRARARSLRTVTTPTGRWRVGAQPTPRGTVTMAVKLEGLHREMASIAQVYSLTIPLMLALLAVGAWGAARGALASVQGLSQEVGQVTAAGLHQRLPTVHIDRELLPLVHSINALLGRLERSFQQASRFSGDAAHELKTPLTILQGELEQAMAQVAPGSSQQQQLAHLLEEVRRLSTIVRKLLLLSLADGGLLTVQRETVDLVALLEDVLGDVDWIAPHLTVNTHLPPALTTQGDRDLLTQLLYNLLSNALKYNTPQGWIRIEGQQAEGTLALTVTNATSLAVDDRIFERFYRADSAHSRRTDGVGLGLSLAQEIARAHGGELELVATSPGEVSLQLRLPKGA